MRAYLDSLRADLADRRVLPLLVALGVALLAALAYAMLAGHGSTSAPATSAATAPSPGAAGGGASVTQVTLGGNEAVSETTSGAPRAQTNVKNPFKPLPAPKAKASSSAGSGAKSGGASSTSSGTGGASSSSSSSSSSQKPSGGEASKPAPSRPRQPAASYTVSVQFGPAASGGQAAQLKSYENLAPAAALPSSKSPVVVFKSVSGQGKLARFELAGEVLVHGPARCLPSALRCLAIGLAVGQAEQLEFLPGEGSAVTYELKLTGISQSKG
ncbi:MAG TPA: hypothetical protein VMG62_06575 [Solirubrobacteraceae bacterium]|nr:hypothetical protein [Solirubrobacteraceae bacterium]